MKQAGANTRWKLYTAAFAAPVLLLAAEYAVAGFAPFGEKTLLTVDMNGQYVACLLYTSPSPRDRSLSRMPSSA